MSANLGKQEVKQQAHRLATSALRKRRVPATTTPEKVAPIVYALLVEDVDPAEIEKALIEADVLTANGIGLTLSRMNKAPEGQRFPTPRITPQPWKPPTDAEKATAKAAIAKARQALRP